MHEKSHAATVIVGSIAATALAMLLPASVAFTLSEYGPARGFLYSSLLVASLAILVHLATRSGASQARTRIHPFAYLSLIYLGLPALMALPLTEAGLELSFGMAWFEMVSAFTTTGASLIEDEASRSLNLWRATVAWGGGLFLLVVAMAILAPLNLGGFEMLGITRETTAGVSPAARLQADPFHDSRVDDLTLARLDAQIRLIAPVYLALTLVLWVMLSMAGSPPLLALTLAMSTLSTAGIAPEGVISGPVVEVLVLIFLLPALSRRAWPGARQWRGQGSILRDPEVRLAMVVVAGVSLVMLVRHLLHTGGQEPPEALAKLWGVVFTAIAFLTTAGFVANTGDVVSGVFGGPAGIVLLGLAMIGGGVATTAGGMKLLRVFALYWQARHGLDRLVHPEGVGGDGPRLRGLRSHGAFAAWLFLMTFIFALSAVTAALTLLGMPFEDAMIYTVAALTTTGPLAEIAGAAPLSWASLDMPEQIILGFGMVLGRLEFLLLLSVLWWQGRG